MAITVVPASDYNSGSVADPAEYGDVAENWGPTGVLDVPSGTLLETTLSGGDWSTAPGKAFLRGHLFTSDTTVTGTFASNTSADPRYDIVVARLKHQNLNDSTAPNGVVTVVQGTAGGGYPEVSRDPFGDWDAPLLVAKVTDTGAAVEEYDPRPFVPPPTVGGLSFTSVPSPARGQRFLDYTTGFLWRWDHTSGLWTEAGASSVLIEEQHATSGQQRFLLNNGGVGIPNVYRHLRIVGSGQTDQTSGITYLQLQFNGDGNANYWSHLFWSESGASQDLTDDSETFPDWGRIGSYRSTFELVVPYYASGVDKTFHGRGYAFDGSTSPAAQESWHGGGLWSGDAAISEIRLDVFGSVGFGGDVVVSLYGER